VNRLRLFLARWLCPVGYAVAATTEVPPHSVATLTIAVDTTQAVAACAALEARLERIRELTPRDGLVPPGFHLHRDPVRKAVSPPTITDAPLVSGSVR
jgi:hypothetical protein